MKKLLATAALVTGLASAPAALADRAFITENSASQNQLHQTAVQPSRLETDDVVGRLLHRLGITTTVQPTPSFITENSATQNRIQQPTVVTVAAPTGFDWADAGIGAAGAFGAMFVLLGGSVLVARRRDRSAVAA